MTDISDSSAWSISPQAWSRVTPTDVDPDETREWMEAFDALVAAEGPERATFILRKLLDRGRQRCVPMPPVLNTPYANTIGLADQPQ
jgi:pyruvate dehydrogenase E1 component